MKKREERRLRNKVHGEGGRWGRSTHELVLECQLAEVQLLYNNRPKVGVSLYTMLV